ncbi:MAG: tetratricopeptide repeat protein, partial [Alphaproteobacteria bacterium]|nr:tetratricopeptide repeat protein [Alphaproteobacteria bacterium]
VLGKTSTGFVSTIPPDRAKAIEWWEKASRNGSGAAAVALAEYYAPSSGSEPNLPRSFAWYRKAIELGDHGAEATYGSLLIQLSNNPVTRKDFFTNFPMPESPAYKKLQEITPNFSELPKDTGELYELGFQSLKAASDASYLPAQRDLAIELNSERSPHFDRKEAYRLFDLLVERNETIIFLHYGLSIVNFGETKEEFQKAHQLLEKATEMGENRAYRGLATLYAKGRGVKRNPSKAFLYANKCAETALDFCGDFMMNSYGLGNLSFGFKKDMELALYWARRLAQAGIPSGYLFLSQNYLNRSKALIAETERNHYLYLAYLFRQMSVNDGDVESVQQTNRIYRQMGEEERNRANEFLSKWRPSDPLPE